MTLIKAIILFTILIAAVNAMKVTATPKYSTYNSKKYQAHTFTNH